MLHKTKLRLPISGEWYVFWGGDTGKLNHHHGNPAQNYAFDLLKVDEKQHTHHGIGDKNTDYYAFGGDILAPADGEVVEAVDGIRDNVSSATNPYMACGNYVLIRHENSLYSSLAHFRIGSLAVKTGERITAGQKLGECGNSGNSSEPHLHFHLQNSDVFHQFNGQFELEAAVHAIKCYFSDITVQRDGDTRHEKLYSPVKGDIVSNS